MDLDIWNEVNDAGWKLSRLQELLNITKEIGCSGSMLIMINMQIKIIILKLCVSTCFYVPTEIWIIILNLSNHMEYFKPGRSFTGEWINFEIDMDFDVFDRTRYYNIRTNQVCYFKNEKQFYMIIDLDNDYKTITCVEMNSYPVNEENCSYYMEIDSNNLIRIFTFEEFYCKENIVCNDYYEPSNS